MADSFKQVWEDAWNTWNTLTWQERLNQMGCKIRQWEQEQQSPQNRIKHAHESLCKLQLIHPSQQDCRLEEALLTEIDQVEREIEVYWKQRSRMQWTCHGDRNINFFHIMATNRKRKNQISHICDEEDNLVTDDKNICRVFVNFFKSLYCSVQPGFQHDPTMFFQELA